MGFVPQSDIMYRNLTVEENLTYSACFRCAVGSRQASSCCHALAMRSDPGEVEIAH